MGKAKKLKDHGNNNSSPRKVTLVDLQEDGLSEEQLLQETITLIVSGQDTSASANSAALFLLSMNQQVQQEVNYCFVIKCAFSAFIQLLIIIIVIIMC